MQKILILIFTISIIILSCDNSMLSEKLEQPIIVPWISGEPGFLFNDAADTEKLKPVISINFTVAMDTECVNAHTFLLRGGDLPVHILKEWSADKKRLFLTPGEPCSPFNFYTIFIASRALSLLQVGLADNYSFTFYTDFLPPRVINSDPAGGAEDHPASRAVYVYFSETMDRDSVYHSGEGSGYEGAFRLYDAAGNLVLPETVYWAGNNFIFQPAANLNLFGQYTIVVSTAALDAAGNPLAAPYRAAFKVFAEYSPIRSFTVAQAGGFAFNDTGDLFALDRENNTVKKYESNGTMIGVWPLFYASAPHPCSGAVDLCVSGSDVYLLSREEHRVLKYDNTGGWYGWYGRGGGTGGWHDWNSTSAPEEGSGVCEFIFPEAITLDGLGNFYIADTGNNRIMQFNRDFIFLRAWGKTGNGNGEFNNPRGIAVDAAGNLYVADSGNHRVQKFSSTGEFLSAWGEGLLTSPRGIAVENSAYVFVADSAGLYKFDAAGNLLTTWFSWETGNAESPVYENFQAPYAVQVSTTHEVYVADCGRVLVFKLRG